MVSEYRELPTRYPRSDGKRKRPEGWVELGPKHVQTQRKDLYIPRSDGKGFYNPIESKRYEGINGPYKRRMTEGYINQRLPRTNTIGTNQAYIRKVLENPRTSEHNKAVCVQYVRDHPERFTPYALNPEDPEYNRWAISRNGDAIQGFVVSILSSFSGH